MYKLPESLLVPGKRGRFFEGYQFLPLVIFNKDVNALSYYLRVESC